MSKRVAIYARVSTGEQTPDNQLQELRTVAARMGWQVAEEYIDHGVSGAKGREHRPAYDRLYGAIVRREVDLVMAWSVDRLGRSLQRLVALLSELQAKEIDLYLHQLRYRHDDAGRKSDVSDVRGLRRIRTRYDPRTG